VTLDVVTTRHGPIITELVPGETRKLALRWILYDGMTLPFFDVNSAQNWNDFRKAFSTFVAPGQNVMYADVDGHIATRLLARFRSVRRVTAVFRSAAAMTRTNGRDTFRGTTCRGCTTRSLAF